MITNSSSNSGKDKHSENFNSEIENMENKEKLWLNWKNTLEVLNSSDEVEKWMSELKDKMVGLLRQSSKKMKNFQKWRQHVVAFRTTLCGITFALQVTEGEERKDQKNYFKK